MLMSMLKLIFPSGIWTSPNYFSLYYTVRKKCFCKTFRSAVVWFIFDTLGCITIYQHLIVLYQHIQECHIEVLDVHSKELCVCTGIHAHRRVLNCLATSYCWQFAAIENGVGYHKLNQLSIEPYIGVHELSCEVDLCVCVHVDVMLYILMYVATYYPGPSSVTVGTCMI